VFSRNVGGMSASSPATPSSVEELALLS